MTKEEILKHLNRDPENCISWTVANEPGAPRLALTLVEYSSNGIKKLRKEIVALSMADDFRMLEKMWMDGELELDRCGNPDVEIKSLYRFLKNDIGAFILRPKRRIENAV
jgi:hypothetical protein